MNAENSVTFSPSRPKITLMLLCAIAAAASIGAANAAGTDDGVPTVALRYSPKSLETESGARTLYRRIVNAAAEVCPNYGNPHFVPAVVRKCREESVERAVLKINSPNLVAVHTANSKKG